MGRSFSIKDGRALGLDAAGEVYFDTDAYPVQFFPLADKITVSGQVITFPDLHHTNAYGFAAGDTGGGVIKQSCHSFVSIPFQEWGPSDQPGMTDTLADEVIGVAPAGADILLVRVKLARTSAPDQVNGNNVPVAFEEDEYVMCDGGTLLVEHLPPITRLIWIRLAASANPDGTTDILLTRKQSVKKRKYTYWRAGNSPTNSGWTWGGTNGDYGHIVKSIEQKGPTTAIGGVITYRRGDGAACSLTDTSDYGAEYTGDIEIIPGKSNITPDAFGGSASGKDFVLADLDFLNSASSTHTFSSKFLGVEPADGDTRHVIVTLTSYIGLQSAARNLTGVTIAGVTATPAAMQRYYENNTGSNDPSVVVAIYIAEVPTGDTGDVVLSFDASFWASQIEVFAAYNLDSPTPADTVQGIAAGTVSGTLDTADDGCAVGVAMNRDAIAISAFTGIDNVLLEDFITTTPSAKTVKRARGFGKTAAAAASVAATTTNSIAAVWAAFV